MKKVAIVYWSGTGNTEAMALAVAEGVRGSGGEAVVLQSADFDAGRLPEFDAIAFGCPAMGAETLEEDEFQPMFDGLTAGLSGKPIALFGSYGWGDGEWMRDWEQTCRNSGADLVTESVICQEAPDSEAEAACKALGTALTQ